MTDTPFEPTDASLALKEGYAVLTFERDDVRNALTGTALIDDICGTLEWANRASGVSALVLTGAGTAFSAGGNIKDMLDNKDMFDGGPVEIADSYRRGIQRVSLAMHGAELPVIAAVNGAAVGAGFDLACMCDLRIGCENTRLGETFVNLGIIPGDGGAWFLQRLVGYQRAAELTFSGRIIDAAEARELGLLLEVVDSGQLLTRAEALATDFAAKPPQALRMAKRLLKSAQRMELPDFLELCASMQAACHHTEDHRRALEGFVGKHRPEFTGR